MPVPSWSRLDDFARDLAAVDVRLEGAVRPALYGFRGDTMLAGVELRPHPAGGYQAPMVEALALLVPLGADRLAFLGSGRAWSLDDPVPPVSGAGDLRQRVAMLVAVDSHRRPAPASRSVLMPYSLDAGEPEWDEPVHIDEAAEGPIAGMLELALQGEFAASVDTDPLTVGRQALRLARLDHGLQLPGEGGDAKLAGCILAALQSEGAGEPQPDWVLTPPASQRQ